MFSCRDLQAVEDLCFLVGRMHNFGKLACTIRRVYIRHAVRDPIPDSQTEGRPAGSNPRFISYVIYRRSPFLMVSGYMARRAARRSLPRLMSRDSSSRKQRVFTERRVGDNMLYDHQTGYTAGFDGEQIRYTASLSPPSWMELGDGECESSG